MLPPPYLTQTQEIWVSDAGYLHTNFLTVDLFFFSNLWLSSDFSLVLQKEGPKSMHNKKEV